MFEAIIGEQTDPNASPSKIDGPSLLTAEEAREAGLDPEVANDKDTGVRVMKNDVNNITTETSANCFAAVIQRAIANANGLNNLK